MKISLIFTNNWYLSAQFQLKVSKNEDAFFPDSLSSLHSPSPTPWVRTPRSEGVSECPLVGWLTLDSESLRHDGHKSSVCRGAVLLLGLLLCSADQFICPCAGVHCGFLIFLLCGKASSPVSLSSHTSGVQGLFWFLVLPYEWWRSER